MALSSLPVPVEILETVLRFVPVNENFRLDQPANENAPPVSRGRPFDSVRVNKFWRLQFAYKQWMEIVQLHLGEFELKVSASSDSDQEVGDDETPIIWNEFVAFNLGREINGIKGLDHLTWSYLNCYVASVNLFYHIPANIGSSLCKDRLARTLKQISGFFADQQLRLDLRLRILDAVEGGAQVQAFPVPPGSAALEIPSKISLDNLSVTGAGPYIGLLQSLLLAGQGSLKSLSADVSVLLPALDGLAGLSLPGVATLKLRSFARAVPQGGQNGASPNPLATVARALPNLTTLQLHPPKDRLASLQDMLPAPQAAGPAAAAFNIASLPALLQQIQATFPVIQQRLQHIQAQLPALGQQVRALMPAVAGGRLRAPGPGAAVPQRGLAPAYGRLAALGVRASVPLAGPVIPPAGLLPPPPRLQLPPLPNFPAGLIGVGPFFAPFVMTAALDLQPLTLCHSLADLGFAWPSLHASQSILAIEHERIRSLSLRLRIGPEVAGTPFDSVAECQMWLKTARRLEVLELRGLSHRHAEQFAAKLDALSATIDLGKIKMVKLAVAKQFGLFGAVSLTGIAALFAKFNLHLTALQSITIELKPSEVPSNFSRFLLENVPEQTRHLKLVNIFQDKSPTVQWKAYILNVIANTASSLPRVDLVEIESSLECFTKQHYDGLAELCHELAEDSRQAAFDYGAYAKMHDSAPISRLRVSKHARVADSHVTSVKSNYRLQCFLKNTTASAGNLRKGSEQEISFLFTDVPPVKLQRAAIAQEPYSSLAATATGLRTVKDFIGKLKVARTPAERHQAFVELRQFPDLFQAYLRTREATQQGGTAVSGASLASAPVRSSNSIPEQIPPQAPSERVGCQPSLGFGAQAYVQPARDQEGPVSSASTSQFSQQRNDDQ